jgi:CO dehydrogenase/acetyl-CoA synthase epsilon subunit
MTSTGTFDILNYKGVEKDIQHLFAKFAYQNRNGKITFDFFDQNGKQVDCEIMSLHRLKQAAFGISALNISGNVRSVFVSDSYASLIYFTNLFKSRISFEEAGFLVVGAQYDQELLGQVFLKIPKKAKINTVFSASILGRVMDCKIQDLIHCRDCTYRLAKDLVQVRSQKTNKESTESLFSFSLRTYCISQGIVQTVRTFKPKQKGVESFYHLNQLNWNELN